MGLGAEEALAVGPAGALPAAGSAAAAAAASCSFCSSSISSFSSFLFCSGDAAGGPRERGRAALVIRLVDSSCKKKKKDFVSSLLFSVPCFVWSRSSFYLSRVSNASHFFSFSRPFLDARTELLRNFAKAKTSKNGRRGANLHRCRCGRAVLRLQARSREARNGGGEGGSSGDEGVRWRRRWLDDGGCRKCAAAKLVVPAHPPRRRRVPLPGGLWHGHAERHARRGGASRSARRCRAPGPVGRRCAAADRRRRRRDAAGRIRRRKQPLLGAVPQAALGVAGPSARRGRPAGAVRGVLAAGAGPRGREEVFSKLANLDAAAKLEQQQKAPPCRPESAPDQQQGLCGARRARRRERGAALCGYPAIPAVRRGRKAPR